MTLPLAAQLDVWRLKFELPPQIGGVVRDFDLRTPAVLKDAIVGLNLFPKQRLSQVYVGEVDPVGGYVDFVRLESAYRRNIEGRSVVRNGARDGYIIAMIEYKSGGMDTLLSLINIDTAGVHRWRQIIDIQDSQGRSYSVVVPTKILEYRDSIYLVCGYARMGEQQDVFLLQIDEQGQIRWIQLYRDVATADHDVSPLWCWDMEKLSSGVVVLVGSRITDFYTPPPPAGCVNERQQGWLLVVDGINGVPIGNIAYVEPKYQCTEFRKVRIAEEPTTGKAWVLAVGWGTLQVTGIGFGIYPQIYIGEVGQLINGKVWFQDDGRYAGSQVIEKDRYEDIEYWIIADTLYRELGVVGWGYRDYWGYERGRYEPAEIDKTQMVVGVVPPGIVYEDNGETKHLRHIEKGQQDSVLYVLGWWEQGAVLWGVDGRLSRPRGEVRSDCRELYDGVPLRPADMVAEQVQLEQAQYREVYTKSRMVQRRLDEVRRCDAVLP